MTLKAHLGVVFIRSFYSVYICWVKRKERTLNTRNYKFVLIMLEYPNFSKFANWFFNPFLSKA